MSIQYSKYSLKILQIITVGNNAINLIKKEVLTKVRNNLKRAKTI